MQKTRKSFPRLFGKKKESVKVEEGEMKMEMEIKKAEEEAKEQMKKSPVASTSKIEGPENIIFNLELWKRKLTAGKDPPKDLLHALQCQLEASIGKG